MERARRIDDFWSWLPAFRAVAETEHLPSASALLRVTPSALSRTIKLLEESVGHPLFDRRGRRIELNAAGRELLRSVRDAMRRVDEGVIAMEDAAEERVVHVAVPGPFAPLYVLPAVADIQDELPHVVVHVHATRGEVANAALRRGQIDVAVIDDPVPDDQLTLERLRELHHDVFVAKGGPTQLGALPFVAPIEDARGLTPDAWPLDRPRKIGLRVTRMQVAIDAVRSGNFVAALPADVGRAQGLKALGVSELLSRSSLFVAKRPALEGVTSLADRVVDKIRARCTA